jgi:CHAD domain-containing protein
MAEAGRKALTVDFIKMLQNEAGTRSDDGVEAIHDMRVSTRRMRSTLRLLSAYYKPKAIKDYLDTMRAIAEALGSVRDLDVMLEEITQFAKKLDDKTDLQPILDQLQAQRAKACNALVKVLDKRAYREFIEDFSAFLNKPSKGAIPVDMDEIHPFQVRHLLPELVYEHLGAVRVYDTVLADVDDRTLHALRIETKRLRYAVTIFSAVLGSSISEFIGELKGMQDHLGKLNDLHVAQERLGDLADKLDAQTQAETLAALQRYIEHLKEERDKLHEGVGDLWKHFNTKTVQRQLSNAVAAL